MANTIVWFDFPVKDLEKATKFYSAVLDKDLKINSEHGFNMTVFPHEEAGDDVAGCLYEASDAAPHQSGMLIYFDVNNRIQDAVSKVTLHGGQVIEPVSSIGPWGYRAVVSDCEGNKIALYSKSEN
ncbi:MAG: VOC family protein [Neisseriaceae bacterium]|jgi:predicted enzyme related to lactoylglutathione lyase